MNVLPYISAIDHALFDGAVKNLFRITYRINFLPAQIPYDTQKSLSIYIYI